MVSLFVRVFFFVTMYFFVGFLFLNNSLVPTERANFLSFEFGLYYEAVAGILFVLPVEAFLPVTIDSVTLCASAHRLPVGEGV